MTLHVGLLVSSTTVSAENAELARWLAGQPEATADVIVIAPSPPPAPAPAPTWQRAVRRMRAIRTRDHRANAFARAARVKGRLWQLAGTPPPPEQPQEDIDRILPVAHRFEPIVSPSGFVYRLTDADVAALAADDYDVLVRLGNGILRGEILTVARHGILSFHHGDNRVNRGGPWGFWEVYERSDTTGFVLQRLTDDLDGGEVLVRRNYRTLSTLEANRRMLIERSYPLLREVLAELARTDRLPDPEPPFPYAGGLRRTPTVGQSLRWAVPSPTGLARTAAQRLRRPPAPRWQVGLTHRDWPGADLRRHRVLPTRAGTWVADPFLVEWQGRRGVLMEEFDEAVGRATIVFSEMTADGVGMPVPVLAEPFHLSFPWTFQVGSDLFMTPECYDARQLRLYRCRTFPHEWELVQVVWDHTAVVDPMILSHDGTWFLLAGIDPLDAGDPNSELHVFHSDDPIAGDWQPVPGNPQKADPRGARNGGLLRHDGDLFRVGQHQAFGSYGASCSINRITRLDPHGYREETVTHLAATWDGVVGGPHQISSLGDWTVFDFLAVAGGAS